MEAVYKAVFDALSVGALIIEREDAERFKIIDANRASAGVGLWLGLNQHEIIGKYVRETFCGIPDRGLFAKYNEVLDSGSAMHLREFPYGDQEAPDGYYDIDLHPLSNGSLLVTYSNVTERIKAQEDLKKSEAQFRAMMDSTPDYIMLLDLDGMIMYINRTVPDLSVDEVLNTPLYNYLPEDNHAVVTACFENVRESALPDSYEVVYRQKDGRVISFETSVGPVMRDGEVVAFITSSRDISVFREADEKMNALSIQLLEAQETERSKIAQELHDEVGGLLASIQISLALIPEEQKNSIVQLRELTSIVDTLIDDVRSLTLSLRPELLDTLGLEETIAQFIERYMTQTLVDVDFSSTLDSKIRFRPEIETAAYRLVQEALTNIARHAQVNKAFVEFRIVDNALRISISDEGTGFSHPIDSSGQDTLGLKGMYQRATLLGGEVKITSEPGVGTRIEGRFPLERPFASRTMNELRTH